MQFIIYYDEPSIPTTFVYIGNVDCVWQSLYTTQKYAPKTFNIFEAKQLINSLIQHSDFKYRLKPVKE